MRLRTGLPTHPTPLPAAVVVAARDPAWAVVRRDLHTASGTWGRLSNRSDYSSTDERHATLVAELVAHCEDLLRTERPLALGVVVEGSIYVDTVRLQSILLGGVYAALARVPVRLPPVVLYRSTVRAWCAANGLSAPQGHEQLARRAVAMLVDALDAADA